MTQVPSADIVKRVEKAGFLGRVEHCTQTAIDLTDSIVDPLFGLYLS